MEKTNCSTSMKLWQSIQMIIRAKTLRFHQVIDFKNIAVCEFAAVCVL